MVVKFPPLRDFQSKAHLALRQGFKDGHKNQMIMAPTGSGKTILAMWIIHEALQKGRRATFVCDRTALINQTSQVADGLGLTDHAIIQAQHPRRDTARPLQIASIQTISKRGFWPDSDIVVVDEAHAQYKSWVEHAKQTKSVVLGLSATPFSKGLGKVFTNLINVTSMHELTQAGILVPMKVYSCTQMDMKGAEKDKSGEWTERAAEQRGKAIIGDVVSEWLKLSSDRKTIVFGATIKHCEEMAAKFLDAGVMAAVYTSETKDDERLRLLTEFKKPDSILRVLLTVEALAKGFDQADVSCVVDCRPLSKSLSSFMQMCLDTETEILTSDGWKGCDNVSVGDTCAAFDMSSEKIEWCSVDEKIDRAMSPGELMYGYDGNNANIRITDQHDLIVKSRRGAPGSWKKQTAKEVASRKDLTVLPVAGLVDLPDAPISDDEIKFIGWVLTDGSIGKGVTIAQSTDHDEYCIEIERVLTACGFGWGVSELRRYGNEFGADKDYPSCNQYRIPFNTPKHKERNHLRGCGTLREWLDKSIPRIFDSLSVRQFGVLVEAMFLGDGRKYANKDYVSKTIEITCGDNEQMADRLQALAVVRGWRCNKSTHTYNAKPLFNLRFRNHRNITIAGVNVRDGAVGGKKPYKRTRLELVEFANNERVWCVSNRLGTLITRRHGKVVILGNCGRGLRSHPSKTNCHLHDHSGNIVRMMEDFTEVYFNGLAALDDGEKLDKKQRDTDEPEVKDSACPACGYKPFFKRCMACGHEKQAPSMIAHEAGEMREITIGKGKHKTKLADDHKHLWDQVASYARIHSAPEKQPYRAKHLFTKIAGFPPASEWAFATTPDVPVTDGVHRKIRSINIAYSRGIGK